MQQHQMQQQNTIGVFFLQGDKKNSCAVNAKAPEVKQTDSCDKYMLLCMLYIPFGALLIAVLIALR